MINVHHQPYTPGNTEKVLWRPHIIAEDKATPVASTPAFVEEFE
jgi:hypothetical protein